MQALIYNSRATWACCSVPLCEQYHSLVSIICGVCFHLDCESGVTGCEITSEDWAGESGRLGEQTQRAGGETISWFQICRNVLYIHCSWFKASEWNPTVDHGLWQTAHMHSSTCIRLSGTDKWMQTPVALYYGLRCNLQRSRNNVFALLTAGWESEILPTDWGEKHPDERVCKSYPAERGRDNPSEREFIKVRYSIHKHTFWTKSELCETVFGFDAARLSQEFGLFFII